MERQLLIDADITVYMAAAACQKEIDWDGDGSSEKQVLLEREAAIAQVEDAIEGLKEKLDTPKVRLAFTSQANWRKELNPEYKSNRAGKEKPLLLSELKKWCTEHYSCICVKGLEADDVLGIWSDEPGSTIVSIDKDMRCIPNVFVYNPKKDELLHTGEEAALRWHMTQALTGDSTDGYKGIPKVGPKKAEKILEGTRTPKEMWDAVSAAYEGAGLTLADAIMNARMAHILTSRYWNAKERRPILWTPPE